MGDPVAVVVAVDRYVAVDAAEHVIVEYDPQPAVVDPEKALEDGSPLVWEQFGTNKTHDWAVAGGDIAAALAEADVVVEQRVPTTAPRAPRSSRAASIGEPRGDERHALLVHADPAHHPLRCWPAMLDMPEDKLRVVAPDVGGGFGAKLQLYGEEALVLALARKLGRPVKWTETRSEHMATSHHGRDQIATSRSARSATARSPGVKARIVADLGAYHQLLTPFIPELGFPVAGGCYKFAGDRPALHRASSRTSWRPTRSAAPAGRRRPTGSR